MGASLVLLRVTQASAQPAPEPAADPAEAADPAAPPADAADPAAPPADAADSTAPAAEAADPAAPPAGSAEPAAPDKPKPPPYSLPFQLRPVVAGSVLRSDTAVAFYNDPKTDASGATVVSTLLFSYKVIDELAPLVRLGIVSNSPPAGESGFGFMNPVLGAAYALKLTPELRLNLFLGFTVPIGSGGGDEPSPENVAANGAGIRARSAMDNAMFAVNDFTVFPGVGFAYVAHGFTAQVEATLLQLTRVRGENVQADSAKTNFTAGVHLGYFLIPALSLGVELRHQRWISTPAAVKADATRASRDTSTLAFGPRGHFKLGEKMWLRPGVAFALAIDDPVKNADYKILQIDVPFVF